MKGRGLGYNDNARFRGSARNKCFGGDNVDERAYYFDFKASQPEHAKRSLMTVVLPSPIVDCGELARERSHWHGSFHLRNADPGT